ncbi:MAG TPA: amidohydrolase family protein [Chloroflexia bacterium]|nr:amidohydrolase family protein [Chloroflexia bacterium]
MDIVDAQVHFNLLGDLAAGVAAMDAVGVKALVYDEFWGFDAKSRILPGFDLPGGAFRYTFPLAEEAALKYPERFTYLVRFDRDDPDLDYLISTVKTMPQRVALRVVPWTPEGFEQFGQGADEPIFAAAQKYNVPIFVLLPGRTHLLAPYLEKFPDVQVIVDHCGVPISINSTPADPFEGFEQVLSMARYPNVALKWCHAPRLSSTPYPYPDLMPVLLKVLEAFGPQRIMWASDHSQSKGHHSWAESLYYIRDSGELSESDKEWILGRSVRKILNWPPPAIEGSR